MSARAARGVLALVTVALLAAAWRVRLPEFWGDAATYYTAAWSVAEDGDLRYEARDLFRVRREFPGGPQGIFLKRASGGLTWDTASGFPWVRRVRPDEQAVYFAKAFTYAVVAAPLVRLFGTRGLVLTNALAFAAALALAYAELRRRAGAGAALAGAAALFAATVAPVYVLWWTPEVLTLAVIMGGLLAWRRGRPLLAAVLLGIATYTKPYNLFLALPLGLEPLLAWRGGGWRALGESARRGAALALVVVALFGLNVAFTGEANYQGGERKTFYGRFPEDVGPDGQKVTFGNSGIWMTTDQLGPLVEGKDDAVATARTGPARDPREIRLSFARNLGYWWGGRFGGAVPYFFPAVLALGVFLLRGPRDAAGWLAVAALAVSWVFYITQIPDNWYGGGGTIGNRYFLNLLPLAVFFLPRGREVAVAVVGALASAAFLAPVWLSPLAHSLRPGDHATHGLFRALPPELTMLNDLGVFTEPWRKKQPYGDTEGDPHLHWPADPKAYYVYFLDDGTHGRESRGAVEGFWLVGGEPSEIVVRALEPVRTMRVRVTGGEAGDRVTVRVAGREQTAEVGPDQAQEMTFATPPGFPYYDTFLHRVKLRSRREGVDRSAFVSIALEVDRRPRKP